MDRWPNFFIVGAPKSATTSLYYYLKKIPQIYMSPIKEPNYFSVKTIQENSPERPIRDKKKYLNLFKKVKNEKFFGEASTTYLSDEKAPYLIHDVIPDAHILVSLRDPVERVFSEYLMLKKQGWLKTNFSEDIQIALKKESYRFGPNRRLVVGLYFQSLRRYLNVFGKDNVKIIVFEEFIENPKKTIEEILKFLRVDFFLDDFKGKPYNPYAVYRGQISQKILRNKVITSIVERTLPQSLRSIIRTKIFEKKELKPKMTSIDKNMLIEFYQDDVQKLQSMLGRKLPWRNF